MDTKLTFLPLRAAARAIRVKAQDLRAEADAGRVPFTMIGAEYVFELRALEDALAKRTREGVARG